MKRCGTQILSLAAPFLIVLGLIGFVQREDNDRLKAVPSFVVGAGLILSGALGRRRRRRKLLDAIRYSQQDESL